MADSRPLSLSCHMVKLHYTLPVYDVTYTSKNFFLCHEKPICLPLAQAFAQSNFFGLSIQSKSNTKMWFKIQIHFLKWIDNPIQIQSQSNYLRKNERQQTFKVFCRNVLDMEFPRDIFLSTNLLNARQMLIRNSLALLLEQD